MRPYDTEGEMKQLEAEMKEELGLPVKTKVKTRCNKLTP